MSRILAALALTFALTTPAHALEFTEMSDSERAAFRAEVRAYLLDNPEVLMEAVAILEQRQANASAQNDVALVQQYASALFDDGYSFVGGNPDGDITIVEFMDYRCGYCRRAFEEVDTLLETDGNIRFIVKEYPILGEQSTLAAQFAVAVQQLHGDATYKPVHDALMTLRTDTTPDTLARLAEGFGLDPEPIFIQMTSQSVADVINANHQLGQLMQITGTPTFIIDSQMLRGYVPLDQMQQIVQTLRDAG